MSLLGVRRGVRGGCFAVIELCYLGVLPYELMVTESLVVCIGGFDTW